ncbi:MAG: ECF transporter S component [Firmicutes bacterium]|nr:ECF transporter S component [Bacillota bacterium]
MNETPAAAEDRLRAHRAWRAGTLVKVGMLGAVAFALMYAEFNLPFFPAFLQYDPGDVPALIGGFALGPAAGAAVALVKGVLFLLSGKDEAGLLGTSANLACSLAFVLAAAAVYARERTRRGAVMGLFAGTVSMVAVMSLLNYYVFLPAYGLPPAAIPAALRLTALFNLVKGTLNSLLTFLIYKKVSPLLRGR